MRVLLVIEAPKHRAFYLTQLQPLGALYIASTLESKGIKTDVIDFNVEKGRAFDPTKYDLIGYSVTSGNIEKTLVSVHGVKTASPATKVILGGPYVRLMPSELLLRTEVDALIESEAEDIIYRFLTTKNKLEVPGIWVRKNRRPYFTGPYEPGDNLDSLPFPAIEKVPYKRYRVVLKRRSPVAGIITSRGCPYKCIFCDHSLGFKFRARSPENVVAEIERDIDLGIRELWVADDNFTMDLGRVERICNLIIKKKMDISFSLPNGVRADKLNERLLLKLKKAGCWLLSIAPESGNEISLKRMYKGFTLEQVLNAARLCKRIGIRVLANFIIGFPWESEEDILKTIEFAEQIDADVTHFSRIIAYPKTPLGEIIRNDDFSLEDKPLNAGGVGSLHPHIDDAAFTRLFKKAYRMTMLKPRKIVNLGRMLKPADLYALGKYSLLTRNV